MGTVLLGDECLENEQVIIPVPRTAPASLVARRRPWRGTESRQLAHPRGKHRSGSGYSNILSLQATVVNLVPEI